MLYSFFWVTPWRLNFMFRRFETLFHLHRWYALTPHMKMELAGCSETSAHKIRAQGNRPNKEYNDFYLLYMLCYVYWEMFKMKTWYILCHLLIYCIRLRRAGIDKLYENSMLACSRSVYLCVCVVYLGMSLVPQRARRHMWDICVFGGTLELDTQNVKCRTDIFN
jgi:hypothetical protein